TDGTEAGTNLVKDINPGTESSDIADFKFFEDKLYFSAENGESGRELWVTDGTELGTNLFKDINKGSKSSNPTNLNVFNNQLFFTSDDGIKGNEVWVTNGTQDGTQLFIDINQDRQTSMSNSYNADVVTILDEENDRLSNVSNLNIVDDKLFFTAISGFFEQGLWVTDGTQTGSVELTTISRGSFGGFKIVEDKLSFQKLNLSGLANWVSDGTVGGTFQTSFISNIELSNNITPSNNNPVPNETVDNISPLKDIISGINVSNPDNFINFDNQIFFTADSSEFGRELWVTNRTIDGTFLVEDINPGSDSSNPSQLTVFDNKLFFSADDGEFGRELWKVEPLNHPPITTDNFV
ncbi:MAG: hypothetical protein MJK14_04315, partial [Rivularia sp. ALOHA_DT_140]|nr:hypothetical protein [Rivularia sp. ALOHA_DT_140]